MKFLLALLLCTTFIFANETSESENWLSEAKLDAYKVNYVLPLSYTSHTYHSYFSDTQYKHVEVEIQMSVKYNFLSNILGYGGKYYIAYSQHAFWQLYAYSKPFRENIYNPEMFAVYELEGFEEYGLKRLKVGYEHQSNGQPNTDYTIVNSQRIGNISRGINTVNVGLGFEFDHLYTNLKLWYPVASLDDNPNIMDYIGYSGVEMKYFYNDKVFSLNARGNFATKKGSVELAYAHPLANFANVYFKVFSGYTETLIDYEEYVTKFSVGISFSR